MQKASKQVYPNPVLVPVIIEGTRLNTGEQIKYQ